jgi:hypothetical protein
VADRQERLTWLSSEAWGAPPVTSEHWDARARMLRCREMTYVGSPDCKPSADSMYDGGPTRSTPLRLFSE